MPALLGNDGDVISDREDSQLRLQKSRRLFGAELIYN